MPAAGGAVQPPVRLETAHCPPPLISSWKTWRPSATQVSMICLKLLASFTVVAGRRYCPGQGSQLIPDDAMTSQLPDVVVCLAVWQGWRSLRWLPLRAR